MTKSEMIASEKEWTHNFLSENVEDKPVQVTISAPEERIPGLCNRLNLYSIESLVADLVLARNPVNKVIHVSGKIKADVHQKCVITTEPVAEHVEDTFEAWFSEPTNAVSFTKAKRERVSSQERNEQPMLEEYDDPENVVDGKIDLGELVTQHLSLSLNPYPRLEGAEFSGKDDELDADEEIYSNPFAALKDWKAEEEKQDK